MLRDPTVPLQARLSRLSAQPSTWPCAEPLLTLTGQLPEHRQQVEPLPETSRKEGRSLPRGTQQTSPSVSLNPEASPRSRGGNAPETLWAGDRSTAPGGGRKGGDNTARKGGEAAAARGPQGPLWRSTRAQVRLGRHGTRLTAEPPPSEPPSFCPSPPATLL